MLRLIVLSLAALLLVSCHSKPVREIVVVTVTKEAPLPEYQGKHPPFRYSTSVTRHDTTFLYHATPDRRFVYGYVYVQNRLASVDVYDYERETAENFLDFVPKHYQIAIPQGTVHGGVK
jgi:hypothetical protein